MKNLCVFCGSKHGARPEYGEAARGLGRLLAERGIGLVYGGGNVGLMGEVADATLDAGGTVVGVIPRMLKEREVAHTGLTELVLVDSMAERKIVMLERADAFLCLPGGYGTADELFEAVTWTQLRIHNKPVGLLEVRGFWRDLVSFLDHTMTEGFLFPEHRDLIIVDESPVALLDALDSASCAGPSSS